MVGLEGYSGALLLYLVAAFLWAALPALTALLISAAAKKLLKALDAMDAHYEATSILWAMHKAMKDGVRAAAEKEE